MIAGSQGHPDKRFPAVWIGLAEVLPLPGNDELGTAAGAIVNVIARAENSDQFARMVEHALDSEGYYLKVLEDVEQLYERMRKHSVDGTILELAARAVADRTVQFGAFHTYEKDETLN